MSDSRKLRVLHAAEDFAAAVLMVAPHVIASRAPGLRAQLVRAATAVPANIAEAAQLGTDANFRRQLRLALGSAHESASHLRILLRCGALSNDRVAPCTAKCAVVCRMLSRLIKAIDEREAHRIDRRDDA